MTQTRDPRTTPPPAGQADASYASVLVPLDGSDRAASALAPGRALAAAFDAELHVVVAGIHRDERWWYESYVDRLREHGLDATAHLSDNPRVPAGIVATAGAVGPSLLCMATHGRSRRAALTGSTFAAVAATIGRPLVAVGEGATQAGDGPPPDRIVACVDGRPQAERALPVVAAWARRLGLRVSVVTAADPLLVRSTLGRHRRGATGQYLPDGDPQAYLAALATSPAFAGVTVDTEVLWGLASPHVTIGEHLDRHPALVAAATTHARTGFARAALGSEAAQIVRRSPVPVLVVPPRHR